MRKDPRRGRRNSNERFVKIDMGLFRSDAYRVLTPAERSILIEVMGKYDSFNNGRLAYAVREGERIGLSRSTTARALTRLEELGFLKVTVPSGFNQNSRKAATFELTMFPTSTTPATREFRAFKVQVLSPMGGSRSPMGGTVSPVGGTQAAEIVRRVQQKSHAWDYEGQNRQLLSPTGETHLYLPGGESDEAAPEIVPLRSQRGAHSRPARSKRENGR